MANKKPVIYYQTDPRWKNTPYRVQGENSTIMDSGCGPTSAAMLIETITGKTCTPVATCAWSVAHGYKAPHQGTYYSYFVPQFKAYDIPCFQLSWENTYHKPTSKVHDQAFDYLKQGFYLIALMKKGLWTNGGHFVVVWDKDSKVRINDPASTKDARVNGDINTFKNEVAYYWVVDGRSVNKGEPDLTEAQTRTVMKDEINKYFNALKDNDCSSWSKEAREFVISKCLLTGSGPADDPNYQWEAPLTREQLAQVLYNFVKTYHLE